MNEEAAKSSADREKPQQYLAQNVKAYYSGQLDWTVALIGQCQGSIKTR